jgi:hypothetical protein
MFFLNIPYKLIPFFIINKALLINSFIKVYIYIRVIIKVINKT